VENPLQSDLIKEKIKNTVIEKYGVEHISQFNEFKIKRELTNIERRGVKNPFQDENVKRKIRETQSQNGNITLIFGKTPSAWSSIFSISDTILYNWLKINPNYSDDEFISFCKNYKTKASDIENIFFNRTGYGRWNKTLLQTKYKPDFKITENIYVNIDGLYWHSEKHLNNDYHFNIRKKFEENNLRLLQFRANEIINKMPIVESIIKKSLHNSIVINAKRLKSISKEQADRFFESNHLKGKSDSDFYFGFCDKEIQSAIAITLTQERIIIDRYCSKLNVVVNKDFIKFTKMLKKQYELPIQYILDMRYEIENFLLENNFELEREDLCWEWTDFKKTYQHVEEVGHLNKLKLYKIYDAGQKTYLLKK
jgi:hypothetical protein